MDNFGNKNNERQEQLYLRFFWNKHWLLQGISLFTQETMAEITNGMGHLDAFTEDLEKKVDDMLKAQQS